MGMAHCADHGRREAAKERLGSIRRALGDRR